MYLSWHGILYAEEIIEIFLNLRPIASRQTVFTKSHEIYLGDSAGYSVDGNRELKRFPRLNGRANWHRAYYRARAVSPLGKKEELTEEGIGWAGGEGNENSKGRADQRAAATDREPADLTKNLFRAFSASTIRALPDRILSSVSWIHSGNRMEGKRTRPRRPKFISSNSFHVTVKGKSPSRADVVLWKNHEEGGGAGGRGNVWPDRHCKFQLLSPYQLLFYYTYSSSYVDYTEAELIRTVMRNDWTMDVYVIIGNSKVKKYRR